VQLVDELGVGPGVGDERIDVGEVAKGREVVVADLGVVAEHHGSSGGAHHRPLDDGLGRVRCGEAVLDADAVGPHERNVHVHARQQPDRPIVHDGECAAAHPAAEHHHRDLRSASEDRRQLR
jgi:hypothetical protein